MRVLGIGLFGNAKKSSNFALIYPPASTGRLFLWSEDSSAVFFAQSTNARLREIIND
jgi:hypothetical protein